MAWLVCDRNQSLWLKKEGLRSRLRHSRILSTKKVRDMGTSCRPLIMGLQDALLAL